MLDTLLDKILGRWDFNIEMAFKYLDLGYCAAIDENKIKLFFSKLKIPISQQDLEILLNKLDFNKDGYISKNDFSILMSKNSQITSLSLEPDKNLK